MHISEAVVEAAYKQVELMLNDAVTSAKTEDEFKLNLGRLQLVGQRMLAIMIFNSCFGTKANPFDALNKIVEGIKRELEGIIAAAKQGQDRLSSVEAQLRPSPVEPTEH